MDWSATSTTTSTARCTACSATGPPAATRERSGWCSPTPRRMDAPFPVEVAGGAEIDRDICIPVRGRSYWRVLPVHPRQTVPFPAGKRNGRMAWRKRPRRRSRERRAPGPTTSGSGSHQGGHDHELGTTGQLLVHGNGTATGSTAASVWTPAPACEPAGGLSWVGPRPLGLSCRTSSRTCGNGGPTYGVS